MEAPRLSSKAWSRDAGPGPSRSPQPQGARGVGARPGPRRGGSAGAPARGERGGGGWVPLASGGKDARESGEQEAGGGGGGPAGKEGAPQAGGGSAEEGGRRRRERGRQAEGGLISMQQRSRARLHCFNTSPLLRANLSPFSRRTLLPQMLLFSNETDN